MEHVDVVHVPQLAAGAVSDDEARWELDRLLADAEFHCTERNRSFLRFVAEEVFAGRGSSIKAYTIAVDVFGRPSSFDPATDPIVRIEATRLRASLARYYELRERPGGIRIDLPKGRYIPVFSRGGAGTDEAQDDADVSQFDSQPDTDVPATAASRLFPTAKARWSAVAAGFLGGLLLGIFLLFLPGMPGGPSISERPIASIEMRLAGLPADAEALRIRDTLMVALSRFQTLRVISSEPPGMAAADAETAASQYRVVLKYRAEPLERSVWWQVIDSRSGEAMRSGDESFPVAPRITSDPIEPLVKTLAVRLAGSKGIINSLETARELGRPTLGNGCVLRAYLAIEAAKAEDLATARACLERTVSLRPSDADAQAMLAGVLLKIDRTDSPTELSEQALALARRAASLAPDSSRAAFALMAAEFRAGNAQGAIAAGRRGLDLNPYHSAIAARLGSILALSGNWEEGIPLVMKAGEIEGIAFPEVGTTLAMDAYRRGDYAEALRRLQDVGVGGCYCAELLKVATLAQLGLTGETEAAVGMLHDRWPDFEKNFRPTMDRLHFEPELVGFLQEGLEKAGLKLEQRQARIR